MSSRADFGLGGELPQLFGFNASLGYVWDVATLSWVKATQGGGGGGGGDASAANQVIGNASLASIDGKVLTDGQLRASPVPVSGTFFQATQPVSAAALPLPSGAATAALQLPDGHNVTVDNPSLAVTGPLTDAQLRAVAVPVSGSVTASGTVTANQGTPSDWRTDLRRGQTLAFAAIDAAGSGDNTIVAADGTRKIKVLSYSLVADAAVSARWKSGAGTNLSGAMSLVSNGGLADGGGNAPGSQWLFETAVNQALVLNLSAAVGARGRVTYFLEV